MEYNDVLLRPIKKSRILNESKEEFFRRKRREREEEEDIDESLSAIEDDMLTATLLKRMNGFLNAKKKSPKEKRKI